MGSPKLSTPELRVVLLDDTEHHIRALNVDLVAWDRHRAKYHEPAPTEAPWVWLNFLAWHVLHREGAFPGTLREFEAAAAEVSSALDDDAEVAEVDPTKPAPELE